MSNFSYLSSSVTSMTAERFDTTANQLATAPIARLDNRHHWISTCTRRQSSSFADCRRQIVSLFCTHWSMTMSLKHCHRRWCTKVQHPPSNTLVSCRGTHENFNAVLVADCCRRYGRPRRPARSYRRAGLHARWARGRPGRASAGRFAASQRRSRLGGFEATEATP